jgi:DNA polymerase III subunit gamma/tau
MQRIALYRKYRPDDFDKTIGQEHIITVLKNAILEEKISHAYLFSGPRGTGKTSVARILAKSINCKERKDHNPCGKCPFCVAVAENRIMDLVEIDAASNRGIDEIRDLREKVKFAPTEGTHKVFIIDEVHMLTKEAFNALLKTLEEPPEHAIFILATTEINKVPATIISRCQRHDFKRIKMNDIVTRLMEVAKKEKIIISDSALETVAEMSEGGLRDAISILDQLSSMGLSKIEAADVELSLGLAPHEKVADFVANLLAEKNKESLDVLEAAARDGVDLINLTKNSIEFLRKMVSVKLGNTQSIEGTKEQLERLKDVSLSSEIYQMVELSEGLLWAQNAFRTNVDPRAILTVLCAKAGEDKTRAMPKAAKTLTPKKEQITKKESSPQKSNGKWQHFLMEIKAKNNTIHAFLRVASPEISGEEITLTFPYKFHKERIEETKNRRFVEETLKKVYGCEMILKCKLDGNGGVNHAISDVDSAASILGGEIVD